jgi:hypothetical protein
MISRSAKVRHVHGSISFASVTQPFSQLVCFLTKSRASGDLVKILFPASPRPSCASSQIGSTLLTYYFLFSCNWLTLLYQPQSLLSSYLATLTNTHPAKSSATIPKAIDTAMDKEISAGDSATKPGISMAFGPADDNMDIDKPATNGASANGKRKASMTNGKSYKDASESESDDAPLVREPSCSLTVLPTEG